MTPEVQAQMMQQNQMMIMQNQMMMMNQMGTGNQASVNNQTMTGQIGANDIAMNYQAGVAQSGVQGGVITGNTGMVNGASGTGGGIHMTSLASSANTGASSGYSAMTYGNGQYNARTGANSNGYV
eukprot:CAMPEP_0115035758 /NCGR_PEP_ID=MMETSP0216-20121206/41679_1 /TAXON_ID=223996 /ORGANISM="Protocruzia adherens, Strain Boccale" /LENGTH=124 /DNA_ID=CAMNT_0002415379 /DNA_START=215 /DNA_END=589 /DNA_ORIENTATION=-